MRIPASALHDLVLAMVKSTGVPPSDAAIVTEGLVGADLRGMNSHGVLRLPVYIKRLLAGGFSTAGNIEILKDGTATALIDGCNGLGAVVTTKAMDLAIAKARNSGIGAVAIRNSNHNGEGAPYALRAVQQDMIGLATTNGAPMMPVWGGRDPMTGPLPLTFAVPAGEEWPIVYDAALAMSSRGKILYYAGKQLELPDGWLVDADGRPTNDPEWVRKGGWILPIGGDKGYKGWGLILMCELLTGFLSGGAISGEMNDLYADLTQGQHVSHFCMAINIGAFIDVGFFKQRVDGHIRRIKASRGVPGAEPIVLPGEKEFRNEERQRVEGVVLARSVLDELLAAAKGLGLVVETRDWPIAG
jgi:LDH2 family malate/lactate/ureidoglycolate dehydrogenase